MGHIFCTEIEILNCRSHDISQKPRQTKRLLFNFWMIRLIKTPILPNCQVPNGFFGIIVHFSLQKLKSKHLVCLSFWDMSCDLQFRISISVQKMCPLMHHQTSSRAPLFWAPLTSALPKSERIMSATHFKIEEWRLSATHFWGWVKSKSALFQKAWEFMKF